MYFSEFFLEESHVINKYVINKENWIILKTIKDGNMHMELCDYVNLYEKLKYF